MTTAEYNNLLVLARKYIKSGRDYYPEITPEELLAEALIFIADNEEGDITTELFWKALRKSRSSMVKSILNQKPELRAKHNKLVARYISDNSDKIKEKNKTRYKEKKESKGEQVGNVGAPSGRKHGKFIGYYHTPKGVFESSYSASGALGVSHKCIMYRCKSKRSKFKDWHITNEPN